MADKRLISNQNIHVSSNEEAINAIRPGGPGWKSKPDDNKHTVTINVGNALAYGGNIHLLQPKSIKSYDVILLGSDKVHASKVSIDIFSIL